MKQGLGGKPAEESDAVARVRLCVRSLVRRDERNQARWFAHITSLSIQVYTHTSAALGTCRHFGILEGSWLEKRNSNGKHQNRVVTI